MKTFFGLHGSARSWIIAEQIREFQKILVITKDQKEYEEVSRDLTTIIGKAMVLGFPQWELLPLEPVSPSRDITSERLKTLLSIHQKESFVIIVQASQLLSFLLPHDTIRNFELTLPAGASTSIKQFSERLLERGFSAVSIVQERGQFTERGSVIDYYPIHTELPLRIEFDLDRIKSVKSFDPETQRSDPLPVSATLGLIREFVPAAKEETAALIASVKQRGKELEVPPREIARIMSCIRAREWFPGCEWLAPLTSPSKETLLQRLPPGTAIILDNSLAVKEALYETESLIEERLERFAREHHFFLPHEMLFTSADATWKNIQEQASVRVDPISLIDGDEGIRTQKIRALSHTGLSVKLTTKIGTGEALLPLKKAVKDWRKEKDSKVAFIVGSPLRAERLQRLLLTITIDAPIENKTLLSWWKEGKSPVSILIGSIRQGFQLIDKGLTVISEEELFGERSHRRAVSKKVSLKKLLSSLGNLTEGDYVVHTDHGIATYGGLIHIAREGFSGDFLVLQYADSKLYLPVHNVARIQKFIAAEGQNPVLDKLSNPHRWAKSKQKVRDAVASLAGDLIRLYAARSVAKGWRYDPMGALDDQFAEEFPYNETPDQLKAIEETLRDLADEKPMDRLVCGDVGFGKTEVAIRAAYKAVQHGRQVAVLVPTTILAEQHTRNFTKRFEGYPIKVAGISRFYSPKKNLSTIQSIEKGETDIIIGTHRLLSKDVHFKDLGLVIIDEEHRFGVKQKEKLKAYRKSVDVLTLTATPIPRTLHMSLLEIRDISIIATPPTDRRVIRTHIAEHEEQIITDAIRRELRRNGQVFFVHNRIPSLPTVMEAIKTLVPEARCAFAHGQMGEHQLENIMRQFLEGELDVLISTTIVESGIDIPNANTMIIADAQNFGLAQLYQLRGRVGRSDRQAYAYFLVPRKKKMGGDAERRLEALQSLDDLGLGFQLAVRDLEIRGAGNLLGKEQSGNVVAVGFELYSQILREAVAHLRGEELELEIMIEPEVKLMGESYIPDFYIPDISERLILYQRLASTTRPEDFHDLTLEIEDRFGTIPPPMTNYLDLMKARGLFKRFGILRAEQTEQRITLHLSAKAPLSQERLEKLVKQRKESLTLSKNLVLTIKTPQNRILLPGEVLALCEEVLIKSAA